MVNDDQAAGVDDFQELLNRASKTPDYARLLCSHVATRLKLGDPLPESWRNFLIEAFYKIADGYDPAVVLGVSQPHRATNLHRDVQIAVDYWKIRNAVGKAAAAKLSVANVWCLHQDRVEEIAKKFENEARRRIALEATLQKLYDDESDADMRDVRRQVLDSFEDSRSALIAQQNETNGVKKGR